MTYYASSKSQTFYLEGFHPSIPEDAEEITDELYARLMEGQASGRLIDFSVFPPELTDRPVVWPTPAELSARIDTAAAEIYAEWARFDLEYRAREAAAQAYKEAGYEGEVSIWIKSFAEPSGFGFKEAADRILEQAAVQRSAQELLAGARMRKYELKPLEGKECHDLYLEIMAEIEGAAQMVEAQP